MAGMRAAIEAGRFAAFAEAVQNEQATGDIEALGKTAAS
jgi:hypothetical protein